MGSYFSRRSSPSTSSPLYHSINPGILAELKHLDLTKRIVFDENGVVASGGYGDVCRADYKVKHKRKVIVAVKRMRFYVKKEDFKMLFEKEIYVWAKLKHSNVLPLLGYALEEKTKYPLLVSEWMENGSAWAFVTTHQDCDLMHIVTGIARGLAYLHGKDVVHSDVKSDNVLISNSGDALLCDFGCSRMITATRTYAKISTTVKGTERYMAPEFFNSSHSKHSKKTDIWAFGMTVFELFAQERPFSDVYHLCVPLEISKFHLPSLPNSFLPPTTPQTQKFLWEICRICWIQDPEGRPEMGLILDKLEANQNKVDNLAFFGPSLHHNGQSFSPAGENSDNDDLLDLLIILDSTESMESYYETAKGSIIEICSMLRASERFKRDSSLRVGLLGYRDYSVEANSLDKYSVVFPHPFTEDFDFLKINLASLKPEGATGRTKALATALEYAYDEIDDWRDDSLKVIMVITDAAPHGINEKDDNFPHGGPAGMSIRDPLDLVRDMAASGFSLFFLGCEPTLSTTTEYATDFYKAISTLTQGVFCSLTDSRLIASVIIGLLLDGVDIKRLSLRYREEIRKRIFEDGQTVEEVVNEIHEVLSREYVSTTITQVDKNNDGLFATEENFRAFLASETLAEARELLKRVPGAHRNLMPMHQSTPSLHSITRLAVYVRFKNTGSNIMELRLFDAESGDMKGQLIVPNGHVMIRRFIINIPINFALVCGRFTKNFSRTFDRDTEIDVEQLFCQS
ncbi:hypothetical protein ACEPAH_4206 [Sanghuangporus vaninii]